jgi:tetratricopeptide (TPR) repeat protein
MRKFLALLVLISCLVLPVAAQGSATEAAKLRVAGSQYEIIGVLLDKQAFSQVIFEYRKILALQLGLESELPLAQATAVVVERLAAAGQYRIADQLLDEAFAKVKASLTKYSLLMIKGKLLKDEGRLQEAIEVYRRAQQYAPAQEP